MMKPNLNYVPLARHIRKILDERPGHRAKRERFLTERDDLRKEIESRIRAELLPNDQASEEPAGSNDDDIKQCPS